MVIGKLFRRESQSVVISDGGGLSGFSGLSSVFINTLSSLLSEDASFGVPDMCRY